MSDWDAPCTAGTAVGVCWPAHAIGAVAVEQSERQPTLTQVMKKVKSAGFGLMITCGIHYKWGNAAPLLFQSVMMPMGLLDDNLFKVCVVCVCVCVCCVGV